MFGFSLPYLPISRDSNRCVVASLVYLIFLLLCTCLLALTGALGRLIVCRSTVPLPPNHPHHPLQAGYGLLRLLEQHFRRATAVRRDLTRPRNESIGPTWRTGKIDGRTLYAYRTPFLPS